MIIKKNEEWYAGKTEAGEKAESIEEYLKANGETFMGLSNEQAQKLKVPFTEKPFYINLNTRKIEKDKDTAYPTIMQGENCSEIFWFKVDRYYDFRDIFKSNICLYFKVSRKVPDELTQDFTKAIGDIADIVTTYEEKDTPTSTDKDSFIKNILKIVDDLETEEDFGDRYYKMDALFKHTESDETGDYVYFAFTLPQEILRFAGTLKAYVSFDYIEYTSSPYPFFSMKTSSIEFPIEENDIYEDLEIWENQEKEINSDFIYESLILSVPS